MTSKRGILGVFAFVVIIAFAFCSQRALGQLTTADIVGTITDSTGAVVPSGTVNLRNTDTGETRFVKSSSAGDFSFNLLSPGHYSVIVSAPGFKSTSIPDLTIAAGDRARADAHLEVGAQSQTVEVEAQTPLLQADNATVSTTVAEKSVQDLPLNGRNFVQLVQLVPGANEGPGNGLSSGGRPDDRRSTSGFSVNGQDDTLNNYVIDGIDDNERLIGTIGVKPSISAIQEISIETNSYAPEAGRTAGGVVNIVTKAGTNKFHGSVYEYFRNDALDARNAFSTTGRRPELRQNQYGASVSGPVIKDKTFFFFDYESLRLVSGTTYTTTVPTLAQYNEINSVGGATPTQLVASGKGTAGMPISPIALNYLKLFPAPNVSSTAVANNFIYSPSKTQTSNVYDARIDQNFNSRNLFYARFDYSNVNTNTPPALPAAPNGLVAGGGRYNFSGPATNVAQQYALDYTRIMTSNLVLDLKAAFTRINNASFPENYGTNADTTVGFPANMNFNALSSFLTPIGIGAFSDLGDGAYVPLQELDNTFQYAGIVSYTRGAHTIKGGVSLIRRQSRYVQSAFAAGQYTFGLTSDTVANNPGATQNNNLASTLVGAFSNASRNYDLVAPDYRSWEPGFFGQDTWKLTPKLTVLYGARYDIYTPFTEAHNNISNFDYYQALASTSANVASALKVANQNGVSSTAGIRTVYKDFQPRVGFSATLRPGTVLRGGYGLSFFPYVPTSNGDLKNAPFTSVYSPNCESQIAYNIQISQGVAANTINPVCNAATGQATTLAQGLPLPAAQTINSQSLSFVAIDPKVQPSLIQQFNLQVEQQFGNNVFTIGYVGNLGQHLAETINDVNVPVPNATGLPRPLSAVLPNLGAVAFLATGGYSNYNGLQTSFQRRFSKGLALDANYTWAHALSNVTGFSEEGQQGWSDADPRNISTIEYGNSEDDIRNRFAMSLNYEFQYGRDFTGLKKQILAGWQTNVIAVWQSGKPFTVVNNGAAGGLSNRASPLFNGGVDRPNMVHSAVRSHPTNSEFFDTTAFAPQTVGTVGSERRNSLYGPHFRHLDLSLFKDFTVTERLRLQFRVESFNLSNTPSYFINNNVNSSPATLLGTASFGAISQVDPNYVPRQIQFALKLEF